MAPFIRDGARAEIAPPSSRPRRGAVLICARPGGGFTIHRVIGVRGGVGQVWVRTRGDALRRPDAWWAADAVLGQVVRVQRGGRWVRLDRGGLAALGWLLSWLAPAGRMIYPALRALRAAGRAVGLGGP